MRPLVRLVVDFLPGVLPVLKGHSDGLAVSQGSSFKRTLEVWGLDERVCRQLRVCREHSRVPMHEPQVELS